MGIYALEERPCYSLVPTELGSSSSLWPRGGQTWQPEQEPPAVVVGPPPFSPNTSPSYGNNFWIGSAGPTSLSPSLVVAAHILGLTGDRDHGKAGLVSAQMGSGQQTLTLVGCVAWATPNAT